MMQTATEKQNMTHVNSQKPLINASQPSMISMTHLYGLLVKKLKCDQPVVTSDMTISWHLRMSEPFGFMMVCSTLRYCARRRLAVART